MVVENNYHKMATEHHLSLKYKVCFALGHVLNDICATIWFTYLLLYLQYIAKLNSNLAGVVLMVGQLADAICTPLVGLESDRSAGSCRKFGGHRKAWHLLGTICVVFSFPMIFMGCPGCHSNHEKDYLALLIPLVILFQFGWAAAQVSHLVLIPELTNNERDRDALNNLRFSFSEMAEIFVFMVTWIVIKVGTTNPEDAESTGVEDAPKFRCTVVITTAVGLLCAIVFHLVIKEKRRPKAISARNIASDSCTETTPLLKNSNGDLSNQSSDTDDSEVQAKGAKWTDWLSNYRFYQVCAIFLFSRMFHNLALVFLPLYLHESANAEIMIVRIPLVMTISGLFSSFLITPMNIKIGKKMTFIISGLVAIAGCLLLQCDTFVDFKGRGEYAVAILIGSGETAMVAISLTFTADLLVGNEENGAFVYGFASSLEKIMNGLAVLVIQYFYQELCASCTWYYRGIIIIVLPVIIMMGILSTLTWTSKTTTEKEVCDISDCPNNYHHNSHSCSETQ